MPSTQFQNFCLLQTLAQSRQSSVSLLHSIESESKIAEIESFAKSKGYQFTVSAGQRRFGPPINWAGGQPPRGSEIFIARLPRSFSELQLIPLLETFGPIYCFRIMLNFSEFNRGFAFCKFVSPEIAASAITILNDMHLEELDSSSETGLRTVKLGVVLSLEKTTLSIYPVPSGVTLSQIDNLLTQVGVEENCVKFIRKDDELRPCGVKWLVSFDEHRSAAIARRKLLTHRNIWGTDFQIDYDLSDSQIPPPSSLPLPSLTTPWQGSKSIASKNRSKGSSKPKPKSFALALQAPKYFVLNQHPRWTSNPSQ